MGTAISVFVLLSISTFIMRVAAVALRITGMAESNARFQALSAFSGTGFTTSEAETVVNYPVRRRIVSILMVVGNLGLVSVMAALASSLVRAGNDMDAVIAQLAWLVGGLLLLWFIILSKTADRILCDLIGRVLEKTTFLGRRSYQRLLQLGDGVSICEHEIPERWVAAPPQQVADEIKDLELTYLAHKRPDGSIAYGVELTVPLLEDEHVILSGRDVVHDDLGGALRP